MSNTPDILNCFKCSKFVPDEGRSLENALKIANESRTFFVEVAVGHMLVKDETPLTRSVSLGRRTCSANIGNHRYGTETCRCPAEFVAWEASNTDETPNPTPMV